MRFFGFRGSSDNVFFIKSAVEFTILQLLRRNLQLGVSVEFSLLSSHWFISGVRQRFTIININTTVVYYRRFLQLVECMVLGRKRVVFVSERSEPSWVLVDMASAVGEAFITGRWVGGAFTNFKRLLISYHSVLKYKTVHELPRKRWNLRHALRGLSAIYSPPGVVFFNSTKNNFWGTSEACSLRIPSGGITDSDACPSDLLYPIPGNDDALGAVFFLNELVAKTILVVKMRNLLGFAGRRKIFGQISNIREENRRGKRFAKSRRNVTF